MKVTYDKQPIQRRLTMDKRYKFTMRGAETHEVNADGTTRLMAEQGATVWHDMPHDYLQFIQKSYASWLASLPDQFDAFVRSNAMLARISGVSVVDENTNVPMARWTRVAPKKTASRKAKSKIAESKES